MGAARALAAAALALAGPAAAASQDDPEPAFGITGDWGGLRQGLYDQGWSFQLKEKAEAGYAADGGARHALEAAGELRLGVTADLGRLAGLDGGSAHLMLTERHGSGLAAGAGLDPLQPFLEVHGRGDIWRLTQLWYGQSLAGGRLDLKLGRMNPGSDFDAFACDFQNLTFCGSPPGNLAGSYWYNWPVSQWGGRLKLKLGKSGDLEGGVYQVNPRNLAHGFDLSLGGGKGVLVPVEAAWTPRLGGLPGTWRIGAWYSDVKAPDVLLDVDRAPRAVTGAPPLVRQGRYGVWLGIEQQVTGEAGGRGLTLFLNVTQADRRTSDVDRQIAGGLAWQGLVPGRPKDAVALAFGATHFNGRAAQAERLSGQAPVQHTEYAAELDYRLKPASGVAVTPNLQYVRRLGGRAGRHALVLGMKLVVGM